MLKIGLAAALSLALAGADQRRPDAPADGLAPLAAALKVVRETKASNKDRDAGPELTAVKNSLRRWIESRLPPAVTPGKIPGTVNGFDPATLATLSAKLNEELNKAALTCGDWDSPAFRCAGSDPDDSYASRRGYVGEIRMGMPDYEHLAVVTGVGVLCGNDESVYLYEADGPRWKLVFADEQNDYREKHYSPERVTEVATSAFDHIPDSKSPLPLIATIGYGEWCSSTWSAITTRLWRVSPSTVTPKALIDRTDSFWWGDEDFGSLSLSANDLLVQFTSASMDTGVHNRKYVKHYAIGPNDNVQRVDPVALRPMDFVDEWLTSDWPEASSWIEDKAMLPSARRSNAEGPDEFEDTGKRCRSDQSLWQVAVTGKKGSRYFQVRWTAPYRFRLVAVSDRPFAGCDLPDPLADAPATLFPETGWRPFS